MKRLVILLALFVAYVGTAQAQVELRRQKNTATRVVVPIRNASDGTLITGASGLDTECDTFANGADPDGFADISDEAAEIGSTGVYQYTLSSGETNSDFIVCQTKSSSTNAMTAIVLINTIHGTVLTGSDGALDADTIPNDAYAARGTAQAATGTTIQLASAETFGDDELNDTTEVIITSASTGAGQSRCIKDYVGSTDTATVDTWATTPTGTIKYDLRSNSNCIGNVKKWNGTAVASPDTAGYPVVTIKNGTGSGEITTTSGLALSLVGSVGSGVITNAAFAAGAIDASAIAADAIGASEIATNAIGAAEVADGAIDTATFAVGAIDSSALATNAIGAAEIADGAIDSGAFNGDAITAAAIATNAITSDELAASALAEFLTTDTGTTSASAVEGSVAKETADLGGGGGGASAADIADAVWDEARSGHTSSGSFGEGVKVQTMNTNALKNFADVSTTYSIEHDISDESVIDLMRDAVNAHADEIADGRTNYAASASPLAVGGTNYTETDFGCSLATGMMFLSQSGQVSCVSNDGDPLTSDVLGDSNFDTYLGVCNGHDVTIHMDHALVLAQGGTNDCTGADAAWGVFGQACTCASYKANSWTNGGAGNAYTWAGFSGFSSGTPAVASGYTAPPTLEPGEPVYVKTQPMLLGTQAKADVNAEVVDALSTDTYAELSSCPAATASPTGMLRYLYMLARNKWTQTSSGATLLKDDGSSSLCTYSVSDNGTTLTRGEGS